MNSIRSAVDSGRDQKSSSSHWSANVVAVMSVLTVPGEIAKTCTPAGRASAARASVNRTTAALLAM